MKVKFEDISDLSDIIGVLTKKMEEMNLGIVKLPENISKVVGYAEDKYMYDGLALEVKIESIEVKLELILKALCEQESKCSPLLHKANQVLSSIELSSEKADIMRKLIIFIDKPNDLKRYCRRVIKSDWSDEKKDKWAEVIKEILIDWKKLEPSKWNKIVKVLLKTIGSYFVADKVINLTTQGIEKLYYWIKDNYHKENG